MNKAILRDAASAAVLARHPELTDLVSFDMEFVNVSSFHVCFDLVIQLHGYEAYKQLVAIADEGNLRDLGIPTDLEGILDQVLDHYRVTEPDECNFNIGKHLWVLGDGDDGGAVRMNGSHEARLWVRTWWAPAE